MADYLTLQCIVLFHHSLFPLKCNAFSGKNCNFFIYIILLCVDYFVTIKTFKATANAPTTRTLTDALAFYHLAKCHKMRY